MFIPSIAGIIFHSFKKLTDSLLDSNKELMESYERLNAKTRELITEVFDPGCKMESLRDSNKLL